MFSKFLFPTLLLTLHLNAAAPPPSELKDPATGKTIIQYVVEPPDVVPPVSTTDPAQQLGLILCFPEHDRPVGDEIYPVREALKRLGLRDQFVILAGGPQERKFGPADHEPIGKLVEWAKKTYPINPRRVFAYGKGEGGKISGELSTQHPEVFTASISYSWTWWKMPAEIDKAIDPINEGPEIYMVLGLRDLSHHLTNVRDGFSRVNAKGYHVIYREIEELGARTYHPPSNDDAIAWASRLRHKTMPLSEAERKLLAAKTQRIGPEGYLTDVAVVGGAPAGEVLVKLLASPDAQMRTAAAETFRYGIFSEAAVKALGATLTDSVPAVRRAAIRALAMQANWRSQAAQDALTGFIADPSRAVSPADRVAVADAIVEASRFQLRGVRQDAELFRALVAMQADIDEEIRTIAANTMMTVRDREFRGDMTRKERKEPEGGWGPWLEAVTQRAAGYRYDYFHCGKADKTESAKLFCKGGAYLLGYDPATGKPSATDPRKAFDLTKRAAEAGHHPAEAMLGMMYVVGKGVEPNNAEGVKWLAKAADAGDALAATNAWMIYNGSPGQPKVPELAAKYKAIAATMQPLP